MNDLKKSRILIVEDDDDIAKLEETTLQRAGHDTRIVGTGEEALRLIDQEAPELVILDIGLPDISGLDVLTAISNTTDILVLMVSGHSREQDVLLGLGLGADDYITKPFSPNELLARVEAFIRRRDRMQRPPLADRLIPAGDLIIDTDRCAIRRNESEERLTTMEFGLLQYLARNSGRLLSRGQIMTDVWNDNSGIPTRVIDVHVAAIRRKIENLGSQNKINGVRGIGYRFDPSGSEESAA